MALQLDARQRAMLEEMHVRVWPPARAAAPEAGSVAAHAGAPMAMPAVSPAAPPDTSAFAPAAPPAVLPRAMPPGTAPQAMPPTAPTPVVPPTAGPRATPPFARQAPPAVPASLADEVPVAADAQGRAQAIATMDWPALQQAVAGCRACRLCEGRRNTVFGVGPVVDGATVAPRVDWLVVGEAPGEQEDLRGEPFVGPAGKLLDNMLRAVGVSRAADPAEPQQGAFIVNVLKCRPPGNRNPALDEVVQCEPYLKRQIALLQPKIILAVGRFAVQSLLAASVPNVATTPLGRLRGKVYRYEGVPVVVSYHPAYLLRVLPDKAKAWDDLCLAMEQFKAS